MVVPEAEMCVLGTELCESGGQFMKTLCSLQFLGTSEMPIWSHNHALSSHVLTHRFNKVALRRFRKKTALVEAAFEVARAAMCVHEERIEGCDAQIDFSEQLRTV